MGSALARTRTETAFHLAVILDFGVRVRRSAVLLVVSPCLHSVNTLFPSRGWARVAAVL